MEVPAVMTIVFVRRDTQEHTVDSVSNLSVHMHTTNAKLHDSET